MVKKEEVVVVVAPLECKQTKDDKMFVARIRALGLTAYGDSLEEAKNKLKKMFATYTNLHCNAGTLEECLEKSKLQWWYESEYDGDRPAEMILPNGKVKYIQPKIRVNTSKLDSWLECKDSELVVAY